MKLTKGKKGQILDELKTLFNDSAASIASNYSGLKAPDVTILRKKLKENGIKLLVTKNSLVKKALVDTGNELDPVILDQPVVFAFGQDEVEVCKSLHEFAKEFESLKILGGIVRGEEIDQAKIKVLALLPGREELQAKLVGTLAAPMSGLVNVLRGNIGGLVNVLKQYQEKIAS